MVGETSQVLTAPAAVRDQANPTARPWQRDGLASRTVNSMREIGRTLESQDDRQIRQAAVQMASTLFFQPLLQEMRKAGAGAGIAHGGRGEDVFGEQLDLRIADSVAGSNPGGITALIAEKLDRSSHARRIEQAGLRIASWQTQLQAAGQNGIAP